MRSLIFILFLVFPISSVPAAPINQGEIEIQTSFGIRIYSPGFPFDVDQVMDAIQITIKELEAFDPVKYNRRLVITKMLSMNPTPILLLSLSLFQLDDDKLYDGYTMFSDHLSLVRNRKCFGFSALPHELLNLIITSVGTMQDLDPNNPRLFYKHPVDHRVARLSAQWKIEQELKLNFCTLDTL